MDGLINFIVVIPLQYIHVVNHIVHLKFIYYLFIYLFWRAAWLVGS